MTERAPDVLSTWQARTVANTVGGTLPRDIGTPLSSSARRRRRKSGTALLEIVGETLDKEVDTVEASDAVAALLLTYHRKRGTLRGDRS